MATLYKRLHADWTKKHITEDVKTPDFKEQYHQNLKLYDRKEINEIANLFEICFVINDGKTVTQISNGTKIFLNTSKCFKIFIDPREFYYLPHGIKHGDTILTRFDDILNHLNIPIIVNKNNKKKIISGNLLIEPCPLLLKQFVLIEKQFDLSINIWTKEKLGSIYNFSQLRMGAIHKSHVLTLHLQSETKCYFLIHNEKIYFNNYFICKNRNKDCRYTFGKERDLKIHEKNCVTEEEARKNPKIIQKEFGPSDRLLNKAINLGLISKRPSNSDFCFFDIECVLPKCDIQNKKSKIVSSHKIVSIAANSFINNKHNQMVWVVKDSSFEAETEIINHFLQFCYKEKTKMKICHELEIAIKKLKEMTKRLHNEYLDKDEVFELKSFLEAFTDMSVFGYNNAKYDNNIIFEHMVKCFDIDKFETKTIKLLKKGTRYFSIKFQGLHFKDLLNFTCPTSLDKYLRTWTNNFQKLVYPYELFDTVEQIRACVKFPSLLDFYSTISGDVDKVVYEKCKNEFERRMDLPCDNIEKWVSFECYLKYYNMSDVYPASCGLIRQFETYFDNFGISPMQFLGLPSFAKAAMFKLYDPSCPNIFSFPSNSAATQIFRDNVIGGLCNVYKRHVTLCDEEAAYAAKFNRNGKISSFLVCCL